MAVLGEIPNDNSIGSSYHNKQRRGDAGERREREIFRESCKLEQEREEKEAAKIIQQWYKSTKVCVGCKVNLRDGLYSNTHCEYCMNAEMERKMAASKKQKMKNWTEQEWDLWALKEVEDVAVWSEEEYKKQT